MNISQNENITFKDIQDNLNRLSESVIDGKKVLEESLQIDKDIIYNENFENTELNKLDNQLAMWHDNIEKLVDWVRYRKAYEKCDSVGLGNYITDELNIIHKRLI